VFNGCGGVIASTYTVEHYPRASAPTGSCRVG
jgi:hypothetical protein